MGTFLKWFFAFISEMLQGFGMIFSGIFNGILQIFNIGNYIRIFKEYSPEFNALTWVLAILAIVIVVAIHAAIVMLVLFGLRKYVRFRHSIVSNEDLLEEIAVLQRRKRMRSWP